MKDIFYENRIIPATSINSIEINCDIYDKSYNIILRQTGANYKLMSSKDKDLVYYVFDRLKSQFDGINFIELINQSEKTLNSMAGTVKEEKPKTRRKKVSDKDDRKE